MDRAFLAAAARTYALPPMLVEQVAAIVAERCALIANRQGSNLAASTDPVGAHIGAAILAAFTPDEGQYAAPVERD